MKIVFVCGSIESNKDGVGDYTIRLCEQLRKQGIKVGVLAFHDGFVNHIIKEEKTINNVVLPICRIPSQLSAKERITQANIWLEKCNPEWLSLQFVIYSFNNKGVPIGLKKQLVGISENRKWHIMFHELWLGLRTNDSLKYKVIGKIQETIVKSLVSSLKIDIVHTHTQFYQKILDKIKVSAKYLPIFSNIPLMVNRSSENKKAEDGVIRFVMFGTIHPKAPIEVFVEEMDSLFREQNQAFELVFIGRSGIELSNWENVLINYNVKYKVKGACSVKEVSNELQSANFGITTNPKFVLEKSGTVAAMREHSLPILIVAENTKPKSNINIELPKDFFEYKPGNFKSFMKHEFSFSSKLGVLHTTNQLIEDLQLRSM